MSKINENNDQYDKSTIKIDGEGKSGNAISTELSRLKAKKKDNPEEWSTEDEVRLNKLKGGEKRELTKIDRHKRTQMDAGTQNAFLKNHKKNGDKNLSDAGTKVEVQKIGSNGEHSKINDNIKYDRVQTYESFDAEIDSMRYLIEYMNNNNKKII
jgi:hypothetical protein